MIFIINNKSNIRTGKTIYIDDIPLKARDIISFTCESCGKDVKQKFSFSPRFINLDFTCRECLTKNTKLKKYGDENYNNHRKSKETKLKKYGNENFVNPEKSKKTKKEKYGDENYNNNDKAKRTQFEKYGKLAFNTKKQKETMQKKYGAESSFQSKELIEKIKKSKYKKYGSFNNIEKIKQTNLQKYGFESHLEVRDMRKKIIKTKKQNFYNNLTNSDRLKNRVIPLFDIYEYENVDTKYLWQCNECEKQFEDHLDDGRIPRCPNCWGFRSRNEEKLYEWISSLKIKSIPNDRNIITPKELDIYIPSHYLAIEYNGLYWHSIKIRPNRYYHQNKVKLCHQQGIRLLHIWEDDWINNPKEVKEKILYYINNLGEEIEPKKPALINKSGHFIWI